MALRRSHKLKVRSAPGWIRWIFRLIPLVFLAVGAGLLGDAFTFIQKAESTRGEVISIRASRSDDGTSYTPTILYSRDDGQVFEAETHISSSGYNYKVGERVKILYSNDTPDEVRINSFFSLYGPGLILSVVGAGFLLVVGQFWRKSKKGAELEQADHSGERPEDNGPWRDEPQTTDPSQPGHAHQPKPKQPSAVRRMR
jgi:hypothetical protein